MEPNFEFFIESNLSLIKQRCTKFLGSNLEERDMLYSKVLEKIWKYRHQFSGNEIAFRKWIYSVVYSEFIDHYRKVKNSKRADISMAYNVSDSFSIPDSIDNHDLLKDIYKSVEEKFDEKYLKVFNLHMVDGVKIEESAKILKLPAGSIKSITHRIRTFLIEKYALRRHP